MAPLVPVKPPRHVPVTYGTAVRDGPVVPMVPEIPHGNIYIQQHLSRSYRSGAPTLENKKLEEIKWNNRVDELDARWRGNGFKGEIQYIPFVGRGIVRPLKRDIDLQMSTFARDNLRHLNDTQMPSENALSALRKAVGLSASHGRLPQLAAGLPSINPTLGTRVEALPTLHGLRGSPAPSQQVSILLHQARPCLMLGEEARLGLYTHPTLVVLAWLLLVSPMLVVRCRIKHCWAHFPLPV
ncbi:hypothetical protein FOZ63_033057 [Perkinsus olseni]|uniref:Uncharacterized protein n=1 Tax=Perkinsus olseni TaxID=32597 RepID=A0A7J6UGC6_PEROL|nr:hypothetical protein FOZ63_033057 [Perkinsus olseni]